VPTLDYRLGIDVGGTNTDAVILDRSDQVRAKVKVPTTMAATCLRSTATQPPDSWAP